MHLVTHRASQTGHPSRFGQRPGGKRTRQSRQGLAFDRLPAHLGHLYYLHSSNDRLCAPMHGSMQHHPHSGGILRRPDVDQQPRLVMISTRLLTQSSPFVGHISLNHEIAPCPSEPTSFQVAYCLRDSRAFASASHLSHLIEAAISSGSGAVARLPCCFGKDCARTRTVSDPFDDPRFVPSGLSVRARVLIQPYLRSLLPCYPLRARTLSSSVHLSALELSLSLSNAPMLCHMVPFIPSFLPASYVPSPKNKGTCSSTLKGFPARLSVLPFSTSFNYVIDSPCRTQSRWLPSPDARVDFGATLGTARPSRHRRRRVLTARPVCLSCSSLAAAEERRGMFDYRVL